VLFAHAHSSPCNAIANRRDAPSARPGRPEACPSELLLQRHAVNLVNANASADKVPVFLVFKRTFAWRPPEVARPFRMIWIVNQVAINPRWACFFGIKKNGVINPEVRQGGDKTNE